MDELTNHCNGLSILNREGLTFDLEEEMAMPEFIIAGKFFTRQALNMEAIASTFKPLWRSKNGFKVKNMGNHIVLFMFDNKLEVDAILRMSLGALTNTSWCCNAMTRIRQLMT